MFEGISSSSKSMKISTILTSGGVVGGLIYGIAKKKKFIGIFGYTLGFGIAGLALGMVIENLSNKD
jgi:hypothetical protein